LTSQIARNITAVPGSSFHQQYLAPPATGFLILPPPRQNVLANCNSPTSPPSCNVTHYSSACEVSWFWLQHCVACTCWCGLVEEGRQGAFRGHLFPPQFAIYFGPRPPSPPPPKPFWPLTDWMLAAGLRRCSSLTGCGRRSWPPPSPTTRPWPCTRPVGAP